MGHDSMRLARLNCIIALIVFALSLAACEPGSDSEKPNIIFILADDLGYGDIGTLHQNGRDGVTLQTPELDSMAAEGMILSRHYVPAPVCAPSRASFITGLHQGHASIRDNQFDKALEDNHNVATTLKAAGYYTAIIGKYGLQGDPRYEGQTEGTKPSEWPGYPTNRGFDYFYGYVRHTDGHAHYPVNSWPIADTDERRKHKEVWENDREVSAGLDKSYTLDLFTARAKKLIADQATGKSAQPFFLFLSYDTPHGGLQLPTMAYPEGKGIHQGLQWLGKHGEMINTAGGEVDSYRNPLYTDKGLSDVAERFATDVTRIDHAVGDILQTLKDLKIEDKTIVIFSSDNGPHSESYIAGKDYAPTIFQSYGPLEGMKRDVYEGGIRVPTIIWGPGNILAGKTSDRPSQFHDWMSTFLDFAEVEQPARIDGVSLRPTLTGKGVQEDGTVYVEYTNSSQMPDYADFENNGGASRIQSQVIYEDGYKGVRNNVEDHTADFKIFDTTTDAAESENLARTSAHFIALEKRMKDKVLQIRMPNSSAPRAYDDVAVPDIRVENPVPGVLERHFRGDWSWLPEFGSMAPVNKLNTPTISSDNIEDPANLGILFSGYVFVPTDGAWTFTSKSDASVIFKLHQKLVIDNDYGFSSSEVSQTVRLEKGYHPFRLYYRTATGPARLALFWSGPGTPNQEIPDTNLFRDGETDRSEDHAG